MKIYVVAHENIVCPKEYRKVEIMKEDVEGYIKRSVAYQDMLETLPDMSSIGPVELKAYVKRGVNPLLLWYNLLSCN